MLADFFARCCSGTKSQVRVNFNVTSIPVGAFAYCRELVEIELPCVGLREIGDRAFEGCFHLRKINLCEGLRTIGVYAFEGCSSLTYIAIPSTVTNLGDMAFQNCHGLKEVQLCEGLRTIGRRAFRKCTSLLHMNLPSTVELCGKCSFDECILLRNVAISPSSRHELDQYVSGAISDVIVWGRFDDLPLHEMCFNHSIPNNIDCFQNIRQEISAQYVRVDVLGMTPLHVLACSGTHELRLYVAICTVHPIAMVAKDKWGETPLAYIMLSEAPLEVLHFFLESHKKLWCTMPFDFRKMIKRLAMTISGEYMRQIIQGQRTYFPDLQIDWQSVVSESYQKVPLGVFRVMLEASISAGRRCIMSLEQKMVIDNMIYFPPERYRIDDKICFRLKRINMLQSICSLVVDFAKSHKELLLDATTILELALWKAVMNVTLSHGNYKIDDDTIAIRRICRLHCAKWCQVVIPNVLSFL